MDRSTDFAPGDVVQLKSGGIRMTIESISAGASAADGPERTKANCVWHDGRKIRKATYAVTLLTKLPDVEDRWIG